MSVKQKQSLNVKRLDKKYLALKESGLFNKEVAKDMVYLKTPFYHGLKINHRFLPHWNNQ